MKKILKLNLIRNLFLSNKVINFLIILGVFSLPSFGLPRPTSTLITDSPKEVIDQVWQIIYRDFLDYSGKYKTNAWLIKRKELLSRKYINNAEAYEAIREMLGGLNDPYTRFMDPKEFNEMRIETTGELMGVGIQISLDDKTNNIIVVSPIEGSPAFNAGIKPKDIIISINGESTKGLGLEKVVKLIRGKKGTKVLIGLRRDREDLELSLVRAKIEIKSVNSHLNYIDNSINVGYIRLKQFNANAVREMSSTIKKLEIENASAYVIDLRGNPGGLLEASVEIARLWVDSGTIVSTKTKDGINQIRKANGRALTDRPVAVLINEGSASASEILSGAIQDNRRGILIGKKTFGKGLVQSVRALSDGSGLTVTVAKYLTPNGRDIHKFGITPDIEVELDLDKDKRLKYTDLGTKKDSQYIVAENELLRKIKLKKDKTSYNPYKSNYKIALGV